MGAVKEETQIALVDGQYMSGKLSVSNGKTFDIQSASMNNSATVPLTKAITVHSGDVLSLLFSVRPGTKNQSWAVNVSGVNKYVVSGDKPYGNRWYSTTMDADGTLTGIYVDCRDYAWTAVFDLSLKINDEVIF